MYYLEELTQRDIAKSLHVSMATVSRGLAKAKRDGIVEIRIHDDPEGFEDLEADLEDTYDLEECIIVPSSSRTENTLESMARAVGELLERLLGSGEILGVSWGETLKAIADSMPVTKNGHVDVIPIIGAMGEVETGIYPNAIAASFAVKLGGDGYLVNTPAILDTTEMKRAMEQDGNFVRVQRVWEKVSTVLLGVSGLGSDDSVVKHGVLSEDELRRLRHSGIESAVNFTFLDSKAQVLHTEIDDRMIKMEPDQLRSTANRVLVAAGAHKIKPIACALSAGMGSVLVTDYDTAARVRTEGCADTQEVGER